MYSRVYLNSLASSASSSAEVQQVVQSLFDMIERGETLTLAEEAFAGTAVTALRDEFGAYVNPHDFPALYNDLYRQLYPRYARNRDGYFPVYTPDGEVAPARRKQDTDFLNSEYDKWRVAVLNPRQSSAIRQNLANETRKQLSDIELFAHQSGMGSKLKEATIKEIIMHSKYVLSFVEEYYHELGFSEQSVVFNGGKIVIDSFAYVHTLFRHYAEHIKQYQLAKSYHFDHALDYENLPAILTNLIEYYFTILPNVGLKDDRIYIRLRGTLYVLWFRRMTRTLKGQVTEVYYRLQTFYPVIGQSDLQYAAGLQEVVAPNGIGLLYKGSH